MMYATQPTTPRAILPGPDQVGAHGTWDLPVNDGARLPTSTQQVTGRFLGIGETHSQVHRGHTGEIAPQDARCSACRWFAARIFREDTGRYVLHIAGETVVPGEMPRYRLSVTGSPHDVVELLTTRRGERVFLSVPAARALAQAAGNDDDMHGAYVDRAVV